MGNLIEIQSQIERLQKQAAEIKAREFDKTVKQILVMMDAFGITLKDLQKGTGKMKTGVASGKSRGVRRAEGTAVAKKAAMKTKAGKSSRPKDAKVAAKYRGPNGETWSGRGSMPRWLAKLVADGKDKDSYLLNA